MIGPIAYPDHEASFSCLSTRPVNVALSTGSSALRVWLPAQRLSHSSSLEAYFSLQRLWAYPFEALLRFSNGEKVSHLPPFSHFPAEHFSPASVPQRLSPAEPAASLFATRLFRSGRDLLLPWEFQSFGFSSRRATKPASPRLRPLSSLPPHHLTALKRLDHGVYSPAEPVCPPERVPTRSTFLPTVVRHLFGR